MKGVKGKIVTVASTKGGVGKTFSIISLAGALSKLNYKVLLIDLDLYSGVLATSLNSNNDKTIFNLVEDLANNRYEKMEDYVFNYNENIHLIAAPKDPRMANKIDSKYIPLILNNVVYRYDVILIDTNHVLDEINIVSMDNSDTILYFFTNDTFDLKNTRSFVSIMKDADNINYYMILNEAIKPYKNYYSLYDIRNLIKNNIDFTIPKSMFIKNIDKYVVENKIISILDGREYSKKFSDIATTIMGKED